VEWTGARYADKPTVEVPIEINAPPERVWGYYREKDELFWGAFGQDALQCAPVHVEAAGSFRNVAAA